MNEQNLRPLAALLITPGLALVANAETTNNPSATGTNTTTTLPDIVVQGQTGSPYKPEKAASPKYTEPLRDTPQTITVVPEAVIQERGATTLRDVLRNVPGISMAAGEGGGGLPGDNLTIRGFTARNDIYVDGIRDYGAYSRDPFNIEAVEVSKGPGSAYNGRGTAGGSINLVSKSPKLDPFYAGTVGFGTDNNKRVTIDFDQPIAPKRDDWWGGTAMRLNGMWTDGDTPGRDVVENKRWAMAPSLAFGLGTPTRVTLSYLHLEQNNVPDYGIPWVPTNSNPVLTAYGNQAPPVDFDNFYGLANYDFEDIVNDMATVKVEHDLSDSVMLRDQFRYGRTARDSAITAPRFANVNTSTLLNRQLQRRTMENDIYANQLDATAKFETGPVAHSLVGGFEFSQEDQRNRNSAQTTNQPQADLFFPNANALPLGPMPPNFGLLSKAEATTLAPYLFETLKFADQWEVNGGVRYDHIDTDYSLGGTNLSRTDDLLSWRAALVFKPRPNGSIYFGYGTAFTPTLDGNTGIVLTSLSNNVNNINLDPEETRSFELGTKWDFFRGRLAVTAALFRTEKINARTQTTTGDTVTLDGEQTVQGVEFGISGSITKDWKVFAGYAYMESDINASDNSEEVGAEFTNTPKHTANLWTTYTLPKGFEIGGGLQYVGERFNGQSNNPNVRVAPDYWTFDGMLAYHINKNVTLRLNVYNIGDERYIDRIGGGHFVPGAGRSAMATAEFRF